MQRFMCSAGLGAVLCTVAASATPLDPAGLLAGYNLITSGDATSNGDIEGAMIVGGNFTGTAGTADLFNNAAHAPADKTSYIYGSNSSQINIDHGGSLYVGGNNSGNINLNGGGNKLQIVGNNSGNVNGSGGGGVIAVGGTAGGSVNPNGNSYLHPNTTTITPPLLVSDVVSALNSYSSVLAGLASNGNVVASANSLSFVSVGPGQAVFHITGAQLAADLVNASISFVLTDPSAPVVVDVDLNGASWTEASSAHFAGGTALQNVLFNFYDGVGTTLSFTTQWETSILAMGSTVTNGSPIEGSLAAAAFVGHGELHNLPLTTPPGGAQNPPPPPPPPPPAVPEPASSGLILAGLAVVGWLRRRKSA